MTDQEILEIQQDLFNIYSGILFNFPDFQPGEQAEVTYDFDCPEYKTLIEKYHIDEIAGEGSDFERGRRLLHHLAPRLKHKSDYDNHITCDSLHLLEYCYEQPEHGINCLNKSKILAECCLALGIYARRAWLFPLSPYDTDCHAITEIYDREMKKWIMLDPTTGGYFVDENNIPLSPPEIRERFANHRPASFVPQPEDEEGRKDYALQCRHTYICKNSFYFSVEVHNGFGVKGGDVYILPAGYDLVRKEQANRDYRFNLRTWTDEKKKEEYIAFSQRYIERVKAAKKAGLITLTAAPI